MQPSNPHRSQCAHRHSYRRRQQASHLHIRTSENAPDTIAKYGPPRLLSLLNDGVRGCRSAETVTFSSFFFAVPCSVRVGDLRSESPVTSNNDMTRPTDQRADQATPLDVGTHGSLAIGQAERHGQQAPRGSLQCPPRVLDLQAQGMPR